MNQHLSTADTFWNKKIPLPHVVVILVLSLFTLEITQFSLGGFHYKDPAPVIVQSADCPPPAVTRYRLDGYQFTHPLLLADKMEESKDLSGLKNEVAQMIRQWKEAGQITAASVYVRSLNDGNWIDINPDETFNPGSLIKVPIMMTYLREAEKNPALLNKKLTLDPSVKVPLQTFTGDRIVAGKAYSIKELLYYMIAKSDNYATFLLNNNVNIPEFQKLFTDVGMEKPDVHSLDFRITAFNYSKFLRMLYNSTYLNNEDAEFALTLLTKSDFADGMLKQIPAQIKVAHKFGEWGTPKDGSNHQLHESGIIYCNDSPMLLTVMTKGTDVKMLPHVISEISKRVFDKLAAEKPKS
ncbi:MAG: serine hydrolase [Bacteroidota bacterium]